MERHTEPPYRVTLKSNGCLILISALTPTHLLVASKHSLGTSVEVPEAGGTTATIDSMTKRLQEVSVVEGSTHRNPDNATASTFRQTGDAAAVEAGMSKSDTLRHDESPTAPLQPDVNGEMPVGSGEIQITSKNAMKKANKLAATAAEKKAKLAKGGPVGETPVFKSEEKDIEPENEGPSHAEVGRQWVRRTVQASGKSEADLAKVLWHGNMTAVLEVSCSLVDTAPTKWRSSATILSKSMSSLLPITGQVCTFTDSTTIPLTFRPLHLLQSLLWHRTSDSFLRNTSNLRH
jgi:tRNA ligase